MLKLINPVKCLWEFSELFSQLFPKFKIIWNLPSTTIQFLHSPAFTEISWKLCQWPSPFLYPIPLRLRFPLLPSPMISSWSYLSSSTVLNIGNHLFTALPVPLQLPGFPFISLAALGQFPLLAPLLLNILGPFLFSLWSHPVCTTK